MGLTEALRPLVGNLAPQLAQMLLQASKGGRISPEDVSSEGEELLLEAFKWRLLLPEGASSEWGSRSLTLRKGEAYEVPRVVRHLVLLAEEGRWDPYRAVAGAFREIGETRWDKIPDLVKSLVNRARGLRVTAREIREVALQTGFGEDEVGRLIAELKATGVMSPRLGSLPEALKDRAPVYELNPLLLEEVEGDNPAGKAR